MIVLSCFWFSATFCDFLCSMISLYFFFEFRACFNRHDRCVCMCHYVFFNVVPCNWSLYSPYSHLNCPILYWALLWKSLIFFLGQLSGIELCCGKKKLNFFSTTLASIELCLWESIIFVFLTRRCLQLSVIESHLFHLEIFQLVSIEFHSSRKLSFLRKDFHYLYAPSRIPRDVSNVRLWSMMSERSSWDTTRRRVCIARNIVVFLFLTTSVDIIVYYTFRIGWLWVCTFLTYLKHVLLQNFNLWQPCFRGCIFMIWQCCCKRYDVFSNVTKSNAYARNRLQALRSSVIQKHVLHSVP